MEDVLSLPEAAIRIGRSWQATYNLALAGKLGPLRRFNRSYVLSVASIEAFRASEDERQAGSAK